MNKPNRIILLSAALIGLMTWNSQWVIADHQPDANPTLSLQNPGDDSKQLLEERIETERKQALTEPKGQPIDDAIAAFRETHSALKSLGQSNPAEAKQSLERALGKIDLLLASHPNLALAPIAIDAQVIDSKADDSTIKQISRNVKDLVNQGQFQPARLLLKDLASEINITSVNLPIGSYPDAIRSAARLIDQGKTSEAKTDLLTALQSLVVIERTIPLPIVRAQALVDEVNQQVTDKKIDHTQASQLLDDANHQLNLAERLGYGTKQDFADIHESINQAKQNINHDQAPKGILEKIKSDLQSIKIRITKSSGSST